MMTLFRPQRGGLAKAMAEVEPCTSREDLDKILARDQASLVAVEAYGGMDERIGWDTYIVIAKYPYAARSVAGFVNGPLTD